MRVLDAIWHWLSRASERRGVEVTRRRLLELNDSTLADIGVSRALLERGVDAWPWRAGESADVVAIARPAHSAVVEPLDRAA